MAERYWSYPAEAENGNTIIVTGRDNVDKYKESGKYTVRIDVQWHYDAMADGMPGLDDANLMGEATELLQAAFKKDKCAVLTGIYTGDGIREWIFYCKHLPAFSRVFNNALESIDAMPLEIDATLDPEWEEYNRMRETTYIPKDSDE